MLSGRTERPLTLLLRHGPLAYGKFALAILLHLLGRCFQRLCRPYLRPDLLLLLRSLRLAVRHEKRVQLFLRPLRSAASRLAEPPRRDFVGPTILRQFAWLGPAPIQLRAVCGQRHLARQYPDGVLSTAARLAASARDLRDAIRQAEPPCHSVESRLRSHASSMPSDYSRRSALGRAPLRRRSRYRRVHRLGQSRSSRLAKAPEPRRSERLH